jgi:hypothetical protein
MREYIFRAWDGINKEMIYPKRFMGSFGGITSGDLLNRYEILMQFTGFKDCKGNDIYEGDVVKCWHGILVVKFEVFDNEQGYCLPLDDNDMEIIGNIFENPELDNQTISK